MGKEDGTKKIETTGDKAPKDSPEAKLEKAIADMHKSLEEANKEGSKEKKQKEINKVLDRGGEKMFEAIRDNMMKNFLTLDFAKPGTATNSQDILQDAHTAIQLIPKDDQSKAQQNILKVIGDLQTIIALKQKPDQLSIDQLKSLQTTLSDPSYTGDEYKDIKNAVGTQLKIKVDAKQAIESTKSGSDQLKSILAMKPDMETAKLLFESNKVAYDALFQNTEDSDLPKDRTYEAGATGLKKNFQELAKLYLRSEKDNVTLTSISIRSASQNDDYMKGMNYIQVNGTNGENKKVKKDIAFGTDNGVLYEARAKSMKEVASNSPNYVEIKNGLVAGKDLKAVLNNLDGKGSYATLKNILLENPSILTNLFANGLLASIDENEHGGDNAELKKNGYYNVIVDVITSRGNPAMMSTFLDFANKTSMEFLGTDNATQQANYFKIVNFVNNMDKSDPSYPNVQTKLGGITEKITEQQKIEKANRSVDALVKTFGGDWVLKIIEALGGKGFIKNICSTLGIDYDKYFGQVEALYQAKYGLSEGQKTALNDIYRSYKDKKLTEKDETESINIGGTVGAKSYNQAEIIAIAQKQFAGDNFYNLLDPRIVTNAVNELNANGSKTIKTDIKEIDRGEKQNGITQHRINKDKVTFEATEINQIITQIITSPQSKANVQRAAIAIISENGVYPTHKNEKNSEKIAATNQENADKRAAKGISDGADVAMYFGAYMMKGGDELKYIISENNMPKVPTITTNGAQKPAESAPLTDKEKQRQIDFSKLGKEIEKTKKDGTYGTLGLINAYTFTKGQTPTDYEKNVLQPLKSCFEIFSNTKKIDNNYVYDPKGKTDGYSRTEYQAMRNSVFGEKNEFFTNYNTMLNIKNMLIMMGNKDCAAVITPDNIYTPMTLGEKINIIIKDNRGKLVGTIAFGYDEKSGIRELTPIFMKNEEPKKQA